LVVYGEERRGGDEASWPGQVLLADDVEPLDHRRAVSPSPMYSGTAWTRYHGGTDEDDELEFAFRVGHVWIGQNGDWRPAAIQFSPLAEGEGGP
jgi:hypothetical protein